MDKEVHDVQNNARQVCERARVGERPVSHVRARPREVSGPCSPRPRATRRPRSVMLADGREARVAMN